MYSLLEAGLTEDLKRHQCQMTGKMLMTSNVWKWLLLRKRMVSILCCGSEPPGVLRIQLISSYPHWVGPPELKRSEGFSLLFPTPSFLTRQTRMSQGWPFCAQVLPCGGREQHLLPGWHCLPWLSTAWPSYSLGLTKTAKSPNDWWVLSCHSDHLINDTARCPTTKSNRDHSLRLRELWKWVRQWGESLNFYLLYLVVRAK